MNKNVLIRVVSLFVLVLALSTLISCVSTAQGGLYYGLMAGGYIVEPMPLAGSLGGLAQKLFTVTSIDIPSHYDGEVVVGIRGFNIYPALTYVTIPDTIRYIERNAFGPSVQYNEYENALYLGNDNNPYVAFMKMKDTDAESCHIHKDTKVIANDAFENCNNIKNVYYEGDIKDWMEGHYFNDSDSNPMKNGADLYINNELVKDIKIPDGVTIPDSVFAGCTSLTSVEIPDSYRYPIPCKAFMGCTALTTVRIGVSVTLIEEYAFQNCDSLINVFFSHDSKVERIKKGAFENCRSLTSISLPASVTKIRENAFKDCTSLKYIHLSDSITSISEKAFIGCHSIEYNEYSGGRYLGNENNPYLVLMKGPNSTSYEIADGTKMIQKSAFTECSSLADVSIPNSVEIIEDYAFKGCVSLVSVVMPRSVNYLGWGAFDGCTSLKDVTVSESIKRIDLDAFKGCTSLESITIPRSVTYIGSSAFENCTSLTSIIFEGSSTRWNNIVFGEEWNKNIPATEVICSDGTVSLK